MNVCIFIYLYATYVCGYAMYVCVYARCVCVNVFSRASVSVNVRMNVCMYLCIYEWIYENALRMYVFVCLECMTHV